MENFNLAEAAKGILSDMPKNKYLISPVSFVRKVEAGEDMFIIDLRSKEDYDESHIKGATSIHYTRDFYTKIQSIPNDKPVIFYCYGGQLGAQAACLMKIVGVEARSVNLGWMGIKNLAKGDVYTTEPRDFEEKNYGYNEEAVEAIKDYCDHAEHLNLMPCKVMKQMMEDKEDIYIMSIRSAEDFAAGHIRGAISIPYRKGMQEEFVDIPKDKTIIVYCYSGQTSAHVMVALKLMGYKNTYSLKYGMGIDMNPGAGWEKMGFEVVTD